MGRKSMKKAEQIPLEWNFEKDLYKVNFDDPHDAEKKVEILVIDGENSLKATLPAGNAMQHLPAAALYHEIPQTHMFLKIGVAAFLSMFPIMFGTYMIITGDALNAAMFLAIGIILGAVGWFVTSLILSSKYIPHFVIRKSGAAIPYFVDRHEQWAEYFEDATERILEVAQANPDAEGYKEMIAKQMVAHPEEETFEPAYTPWYLGQLESWQDAENFFQSPQTSSPNTPYLIFMGACFGAVVLAALILGG